MRCNAPSYNGNEPYAYFAYCVDDEGVAFPSIERMARSGLRVSYPDYENDFAASYAYHMDRAKNAGVLIVLFSEDMITSHIARKFLNLAIERKKRIIVIRLNDAVPTPAMAMQFEKASVFDFYNFHGDPLTQTVFSVNGIGECIGMPNNGIQIQKIAGIQKKTALEDGNWLDENTLREIEKAVKREKEGTDPIANAPAEKPEPQIQTPPMKEENNDLDKTIAVHEERAETKKPDVKKTERKVSPLPLIVSMTSGEWKYGRVGDAVVGRKKNTETDGDITFTDSCRLFSSKHFQLINLDEMRSVVLLHANGMSVNGKQLEKGENMPLVSDISEIVIPGERALQANSGIDIIPSAFAVVFGAKAGEIIKAGRLASVMSADTQETRFFYEDSFLLGKSNRWESGALSSGTISRKHATLAYKQGAYEITVHSSNGLWVNDRLMKKDESTLLNSGDTLLFPGNTQAGIRAEILVYRMVKLEKGK